MKRNFIIGRLTELLLIYNSELIDAEKGISDALDNKEINLEYVEALQDAIQLEIRELQPNWTKVSDRLPDKEGNYWVTIRQRDKINTCVAKWKFDTHELTIDAWKEVVIAWMPYYEPEKFES